MLKFRQTRFPGIGLAVLGLIVTTGATQALDIPECKQAATWVAAHKDVLPNALSGLLPFDAEYRKAIFNALTPEQKAQIWSERLRQDFEQPLTHGQRALVLEAMTYVTRDRYEAHQGFPESWRAAVRQEFSKDQAFQLFETLGPESDGVFRLPGCSCNSNSDCHNPDPTCITTACLPVPGCGPGGFDTCEVGKCV